MPHTDWGLRIRSYRERAGLTQVQLADLFGVDDRTVRRWEAGVSRPPRSVREQLGRTPVPRILRPDIQSIATLVRQSSLGIMLLDSQLVVLAASARDIAWHQRHYCRDPTGSSFEPFIQQTPRTLLESAGGWRKAVASGLSSLTGDFQMEVGERGNVQGLQGRATWTVMRLEGGDQIHLCQSSTLPTGSTVHGMRLTFIEEIMQEE